MKNYNNLMHNELLNKKINIKEKDLFINKFLNNLKREHEFTYSNSHSYRNILNNKNIFKITKYKNIFNTIEKNKLNQNFNINISIKNKLPNNLYQKEKKHKNIFKNLFLPKINKNNNKIIFRNNKNNVLNIHSHDDLKNSMKIKNLLLSSDKVIQKQNKIKNNIIYKYFNIDINKSINKIKLVL